MKLNKPIFKFIFFFHIIEQSILIHKKTQKLQT